MKNDVWTNGKWLKECFIDGKLVIEIVLMEDGSIICFINEDEEIETNILIGSTEYLEDGKLVEENFYLN